ncbi:bestrophin [Pseudoscourfieldia marina]
MAASSSSSRTAQSSTQAHYFYPPESEYEGESSESSPLSDRKGGDARDDVDVNGEEAHLRQSEPRVSNSGMQRREGDAGNAVVIPGPSSAPLPSASSLPGGGGVFPPSSSSGGGPLMSNEREERASSDPHHHHHHHHGARLVGVGAHGRPLLARSPSSVAAASPRSIAEQQQQHDDDNTTTNNNDAAAKTTPPNSNGWWGEPLHARGVAGMASANDQNGAENGGGGATHLTTQTHNDDDDDDDGEKHHHLLTTQMIVPRPAREVGYRALSGRRVRKNTYVLTTPAATTRRRQRVEEDELDNNNKKNNNTIDLPTNRSEVEKRWSNFGSIPAQPLRDQPVPGGPKFTYEVSSFQRRIFEDPWRKPKVVRQNEHEMARFGFLIGGAEGTVFDAPFLWIQLMLCLLIAAATLVIVYVYETNIGMYKDYVWEERDIIAVFEHLTELKVIAGLTDSFVDLAAFLLGMYLDKQVDIWWELRHDTMQELINIISSQCMRASVYFPQQTPTSQANKELLLRYGTLSLALFWRDAHEVDAWDKRTRKKFHLDDLDDLVNEGLMTERERELLMKCPVKSQVVWTWIGSLWTKWILDGRLPDASHEMQSDLCGECEKAADRIRSMLARINTQFPLTYTHLLVSITKVLIFTNAVICGYVSAIAIIGHYWYWVAVQFVNLILLTVFYQGILHIYPAIVNPFCDNVSDFSWKLFHARTVNQCRSFFAAGEKPPYVVADLDDGEDVPEGMRRHPAQMPPQLPIVQISSTRMKLFGNQ